MTGAETVEAKGRFYRAQRRALRESVLARLFNRPRDLLPYDEIARILRSYRDLQVTELREIPLSRIVGSLGRYRDFTRNFLPKAAVRADRWAGIDVLMQSPAGLPPIEVYQIGDAYFVADGNHRVSVARANGATHIEAWVTTLPLNPGIEPGDTIDAAIVKVECAHFIAQTQLAERCGELGLDVTRPGAYPRLLEQIYAYRALAGSPMSFPSAAAAWHEQVYLPVASYIVHAKLLRVAPGRTVADLFVWLTERLAEIDAEGFTPTPEQLTARLAEQGRTELTEALQRIIERIAPLVREDVRDPG
jgi:hypothetical protein